MRGARFAAALLVLVAPLAAAAQGAQDRVAAESLFERARQMLKENRNEEACPVLEESQKLDPAVGTLLHLGECYERLGKTASAWVTFREAAALAQTSRQPEREKLALQRGAALEPRLVWLLVVVPDGVRVEGLQVSHNGGALARGRWGVEFAVDPGRHQIEATAPGHEPQRILIQRSAPGRERVEIPALRPLPAPAASSPASASATASSAPRPPLAPPLVSAAGGAPPETPSRARIYAAATLGVAGLVSLGAGLFFGLRASSLQDDARPFCNERDECKPEGLQARSDSVRAANLSTIFVGAGLAGAGAGLALWLTAPSSRSPSVTLRVGPSRLTLEGSF